MHNFKLRKVIASNIRNLMNESQLLGTQAALAEASGVSQPNIGRILKSQIALTIDKIESIAMAFNVEPYVLVGYSTPENALKDMCAEIKGLSHDEQQQIFNFIRFTIEQSKKPNNASTLNSKIKTEQLPAEIERQALLAAGRSLDGNTILNHDIRQQTAIVKKLKN